MIENLEPLRELFEAMKAAHVAYTKAEPDEVHIYFAEHKAARFRYNVAAGEYVAKLLERKK